MDPVMAAKFAQLFNGLSYALAIPTVIFLVIGFLKKDQNKAKPIIDMGSITCLLALVCWFIGKNISA